MGNNTPARDGETLSDGEIGDLLDDYGRDERNYAIEDNSEYGRSQTMVDQRDHERQESRAAVLAAVAALRAQLADARAVIAEVQAELDDVDTPDAGTTCDNIQALLDSRAARAASGEDASHD